MQLSTSEARAEACTIVLRLLLQTFGEKQITDMFVASLIEARATGHEEIRDEVEWLFHR